jgi:hypothetical protein
MPRIPSGTSSKSRSSRSSKSKSSSTKSKSSRKARKTAKKTVKRELKGKKMPPTQIERIISYEKSSEVIEHNEQYYEKMRQIMLNLRFDRDENLAKILVFGVAMSKATIESKRKIGLM